MHPLSFVARARAKTFLALFVAASLHPATACTVAEQTSLLRVVQGNACKLQAGQIAVCRLLALEAEIPLTDVQAIVGPSYITFACHIGACIFAKPMELSPLPPINFDMSGPITPMPIAPPGFYPNADHGYYLADLSLQTVALNGTTQEALRRCFANQPTPIEPWPSTSPPAKNSNSRPAIVLPQ